MIDFIQTVNNILKEQGKTTKNLFDDNVVSENTYYKYKQRYPSLKTIIKIANYLNVSIDYMFELSDENNFKTYSLNKLSFYKNIITLINSKKISGRKFCNSLNFSRDNLIRWKNGTLPNIQTLIDISTYFNCTIDDLLL